MSKVNLILEGQYNDIEVVKNFQDELIRYGSHLINIVQDINEADMKVDITHLTETSDLAIEANFTLDSAKAIRKVIKKRKRIETKVKELIATSKDVN